MNALVKTICTFVTSSIGRKIIVALTGLCLVLFLAGHLAGNLLIFGGPEWINTYAHGLHSMPEAALWGIRAGLGVIFIIHVWLTIQQALLSYMKWGELKYGDTPLTDERVQVVFGLLPELDKALLSRDLRDRCRAARQPYVFKNTIKATLSSRYMIYTGLTVLVFLVYHLYQYTLRVGYDPAQFTTFISDGTVETFDVYKMIVTGFSNVWCSAFYILAVLMLFSHLRHGVQSIFQTVGVDSRKIRPFYNFIAIAYGAIICLGFISVPVSVLLGIIK